MIYNNKKNEWLSIPNPIELKTTLYKVFMEILEHPMNPVLYQVRNSLTKENVLFGIGTRAAERLGSLLPKENGGRGIRNNTSKREYIRDHLENIEFRVTYFDSIEDAKVAERSLKLQDSHIFNT